MLVRFLNRFRLSSLITNQTNLNLFRFASSNAPPAQTDGEIQLNDILKKRFPQARLIIVKDTSCKYKFYFINKY